MEEEQEEEKQQVKEHGQCLTAEHRHPQKRSAPYFTEVLPDSSRNCLIFNRIPQIKDSC